MTKSQFASVLSMAAVAMIAVFVVELIFLDSASSLWALGAALLQAGSVLLSRQQPRGRR